MLNLARSSYREYKRLATVGEASAQFSLGICYDTGAGVAVDKSKAFKWYKRAAEQGKVEAMLILGFCYEHGDGIAINIFKAVDWFSLAAEEGNSDAQLELATRLFQGSGIPRDEAVAMMWFTLALKTDATVLENVCLLTDTEADIATVRTLAMTCSIRPTLPGILAFLEAAALGECAPTCRQCPKVLESSSAWE